MQMGENKLLSPVIISYVCFWSAGGEKVHERIIAHKKEMNLSPTLSITTTPQRESSQNSLCKVHLGGITFPALKDIAAVSRLTTGLAEWHSTLSARAVGSAAGPKVAGALG